MYKPSIAFWVCSSSALLFRVPGKARSSLQGKAALGTWVALIHAYIGWQLRLRATIHTCVCSLRCLRDERGLGPGQWYIYIYIYIYIINLYYIHTTKQYNWHLFLKQAKPIIQIHSMLTLPIVEFNPNMLYTYTTSMFSIIIIGFRRPRASYSTTGHCSHCYHSKARHDRIHKQRSHSKQDAALIHRQVVARTQSIRPSSASQARLCSYPEA